MKRKWQKREMEQLINFETKSELRKWIRDRKKHLTKEQIKKRSEQILGAILQLPEYKKATHIYAYVSYNEEVSTFAFLESVLRSGKTLCVPKVYGEIMKFHIITSLEDLKPGAYGILEPCNDLIDEKNSGFMLLPGLAFDRAGHRLGYGGGFYDKYLSEHKDFIKVAAAYDFQVVSKVNYESQDIPVDVVVTEDEVIICNENLGEKIC